MNEPAVIARMLMAKTIAVVGLSDDPSRPSHYVSAFMQSAGKRILPVNSTLDMVLGETCYRSLHDLPEKPDLVNVFRLPKAIPDIVEDMIDLRLSALWIQKGILHEAAAAKAESHGMVVVMDLCIMVEYRMRHQ